MQSSVELIKLFQTRAVLRATNILELTSGEFKVLYNLLKRTETRISTLVRA